MVGTPEEVLAYLQQVYPDTVISVIVWTRSEVRDVAERHGYMLTDEEADQRESSTEWANRELNAILMDQRDIDTSAVDGSKNEKSAKDGK